MSDTPGWAGAQGPDEQFTVPVPQQTRELPVGGGWAPPAVTAPAPQAHNPYAGQPVWPTPPASPAYATTHSPGRSAYAGGDPLIAEAGVALFWVSVGWWGFVVIRLLGYLSRFGVADTMLIRTIDRGAEETIVAAGVSVLAAVLLVSVDRGRRSLLTVASVVVALATVAVAIWRVLP